jgi:hypothetical protein
MVEMKVPLVFNILLRGHVGRELAGRRDGRHGDGWRKNMGLTSSFAKGEIGVGTAGSGE